jgi:hypothetical protein
MRACFSLRVEAYFCLAFLFLFQQWKKKEEKKEMTYPLASLVAKERRFLMNDFLFNRTCHAAYPLGMATKNLIS